MRGEFIEEEYPLFSSTPLFKGLLDVIRHVSSNWFQVFVTASVHVCRILCLNLIQLGSPSGISRGRIFWKVWHVDQLSDGLWLRFWSGSIDERIISLPSDIGETDGSSYPNGGLRATHRAGGYLSVDPTSHIFLRGDTIFIPGKFPCFS